DRNEKVYVAFSLHASDNTSGSIEFTRFDFSGGAAVQDLGIETLYNWSSSAPAYNPSVIVDSNEPSYVDPQTGAQITATMAGKGVFVVWNTDWTNPDGTHDSAINMVASGDQGATFTGPVRAGNSQGNHPTGFFTQGTPGNPGGVLNIFASTPTDTNTNTSQA